VEGPKGFVATTDFDWYEHLHRRFLAKGRLEEVNFWQPGGTVNFKAVPPGAPFFFKLKRPHYAVGGFGYFARASRIPVSMAWEAFGEWNGAATLEELRRRLARLRPGGLRYGDDPTIGCLMISEPVFFGEDDWVAQPRDWSKNIVTGKMYPLDQGEGERVWQECRLRSGRNLELEVEAGHVGAEVGPRKGQPVLVAPRLGQGTFRIAVTDAYGRACAVTEEHSLPVLEAAHIRPFAESGPNVLPNGLCLRSDIHRLFDRGYVTVDPHYRFRVSPRLREEWKNGKAYYGMEGRKILLPEFERDWPDRETLAWHGTEKFLA
jgi:putative restriction endonuclease